MQALAQFLENYPELYAALVPLLAAPLEAARRLFKNFLRNRYSTAALMRIHATNTDELNVLRSENAQLIENHAEDIRKMREEFEREARENTKLLLEAFTKRL